MAAVSYQIVLTKADKLKEAERRHCVPTEAVIAKRPAAPRVLATSAERRRGLPSCGPRCAAVTGAG